MKKILIITPFFYPHVGGSQQYMEDVYAFLIKKHPQIQAHVLCYKTAGESSYDEVHRGIIIHRISCLNILPDQFVLPNPFSLLKFLFENRNSYDLIHCSTRFFDSSWWAPVFAKLTGRKIILTDHCATHPVHENKIVSLISKIIDQTIVGFFLHFYDKVYTTNKAAKDFLKKTFGIDSRVIYGGVNTQVFRPIHSTRSARSGQKEKIKVLFCGRMIESKGVLELFEAAKELKDIEFIFAGPGPLVSVLQKEIIKEDFSNIKVLGGKSQKEVAELLNVSDIFVHPSYHHEGFPNSLLEAGASRVGVAATDVGGSKEIIVDGKTGILVQPKNIQQLKSAIEKLAGDKLLREKLGKNLYEHVLKNFNWENSSEELYEEIKNLISSN
ncbi:MAG: glycosyltransferase family 4 protein [Candidatus Levybacteria bacterium]|nr:glycosyltransferase family 4 protein [Candidatus Levybacteria bacterium]